MEKMEKTIITLQEAFAHYEHDIARMSEELYTQQKELVTLRQQVIRLETRLKAMGEESPIRTILQETPPPHY